MNNVLGNTIINSKYNLQSMIGRGQFGSVYAGINEKTKQKIVVKFEICNKDYVTLKNEATILKYIYDNKCYDVPQIYWYGKFQHYLALIIPKYDCSLYEYVTNHTLSESSINSIILAAINIIENIHNLFVVHRDIKPQHFMLKNNQLILIDFGISTFYIEDSKKHKPNTGSGSIIGSSNYASYNLYNGNSYSRRDDLISIGYICIFIYTLNLPWQQLNNYNYIDGCDITSVEHTKNIECKKMKEFISVLPLCVNLNSNLGIYMDKCYSLTYDQLPNYVEYVALFHT